MAPHDEHAAMSPGASLFLMLNGLGAVLILVGLIAILAMDPVNWFGVGVAIFAGIYSMVMSRILRRRGVKRQ